MFCFVRLVLVFLAGNSVMYGIGVKQNENYRLPSAVFTENKGQIADENGNTCRDLLFQFSSNNVDVYIKRNGIVYVHKEVKEPKHIGTSSLESVNISQNISINRTELKLLNANTNIEIIKELKQSFYSNFYLPQCSSGITDVASYKKITIKNIYNHIDWVLYPYTNNKKETFLEYDFVVHPGGDIKNISMQYEGYEKIFLNEQGGIVVKNPVGLLQEFRPYVYQSEKKYKIESNFILKKNVLSFNVAQFNHEENLVIDPSVAWSTYYGGNSGEFAYGMASDDSDNVIVTGYLSGSALPVQNGFQSTFGGGAWDGFVSKFDSSGTLLWATYFGGSSGDWGTGVAIDGDANVIALGATQSSNMPMLNPSQSTLGGSTDSYIAKFNSAGTLLWSTYYGGSNIENNSLHKGIVTDSLNEIIFIGSTQSTDLPVVNGYQSFLSGSRDAFIAKLDTNGVLLWASYYGGAGDDEALDVASDLFGNIAFTGNTSSSDFPVTSAAFQTAQQGAADAFIVNLDKNGSRKWATYFGGSSDEYGQGICMDKSGSIAISGFTGSVNLPILNAVQASPGGGSFDAFVAKLDSAGNLNWASYYGSSGSDFAYDINIDNWNNFFISGFTDGNNFPVLNEIQSSNAGGYDVFITKFDSSGSVKWATYYGGNTSDYGYNICTRKSGCVYVSGNTSSTNFPVKESYQSLLGGASDAFIIKLSDTVFICLSADVPIVSASSDPICAGDSTKLKINGGSLRDASQWSWYTGSCGGTFVATGDSLIVSPTASTTYFVRGEGGCAATGSCKSITVTVNQAPFVNAGNDTIVCKNDNITLSATGTATSYFWNNGIVNGIAFVATSTTTYILSGTKFGCMNKDSVTITVHDIPSVFLGNDTAICVEALLSFDPGNNGGSFIWNDGDTNRIHNINSAPLAQGPHIYWVRVTDNNGCENTDSIVVTVLSCVGISENDSAEIIGLYPNPANDVLNISSEHSIIHAIEFYNSIGELLISDIYNSGSVIINVRTFPEGIYYIKVTLPGSSTIVKRVILRN